MSVAKPKTPRTQNPQSRVVCLLPKPKEANLHETPSTGHIEEAPSAAPDAAPARISSSYVVLFVFELDQVLRLVDHYYIGSV